MRPTGEGVTSEGEPQVVAQAVVLRLYPNEAQAGDMRRWIGTARALWNHLLALQKATYEAEKRFLTKKELEQERQRWEQEPDCAWRQAAQSQARQRIVIELDKALRDFIKSRKGQRQGSRLGFPRFKRKMPGGAFYVANTRLAIDAETATVTLGKLGAMKVRGGRMPHGRVLGGRVRYAAGRWFLAVQFEGPPPRAYGKPSLPVLGIDVGLKASVARSDGVVTAPPRFFRKAERQLKRLSRRMSASVELAKKTGTRLSNRGWRKAQKLASLHRKIADKRRDFLHVRSCRAVGKAAVVAIETLNVKGMARGRLAKSVADAGMGELHRQIEYKAAWAGRKAVKIGRFEPSTKTCSSCGQLHEMPLHRRTMRCDCGLVLDRDVNAARNIARLGGEMVGGVPAEPGRVGPTDVESGVQAGAARSSCPVPLAEASSAKERRRGRAPDILTHTEELNAAGSGSLGLEPLFERSQ
jgi:putative transposase